MKRTFVAIGIATLAVAMAVPLASATMAQDDFPSPDASPQPDGLAAVCEANATDDASLAMCLEIVETVLAPSAQRVRVVTVPTADEFYAGMTAVLPPQASVEAGKLKEVSRYADEARAYLLSVVPDPCYDNMYASAWGVATALQQWRDVGKALKLPEQLVINAFGQFVESPQAISCDEPVATQ